jgi:DNA-binding NtrC family response regulator
MSKDQIITSADFKLSKDNIFAKPLKEAREQLEMAYILESLERNNGYITKVAKELGISRGTLYDLFKKYGIEAK